MSDDHPITGFDLQEYFTAPVLLIILFSGCPAICILRMAIKVTYMMRQLRQLKRMEDMLDKFSMSRTLNGASDRRHGE